MKTVAKAKHYYPLPPFPGFPGRPGGRGLQRGVTLFELLLVLFVAAFVAVAVATIYNRVNNTYKENALFNDTQQLAANIRSLYGGQGNYDGLTTATVQSAGIVPKTMTDAANAVAIHAFSNADKSWDVKATKSNEEFVITISNIPSSSVCNGLATKGLNTVNMVLVGEAPDDPPAAGLASVSEIVEKCAGDAPYTINYYYN